MQFLCIGVNECAQNVKDFVLKEFKNTNRLDIDFTIDNVDSEEYWDSVICRVKEENTFNGNHEEAYSELILNVSTALADYIMAEYEEKLILRIINSNYCYFNAVEKKDILALSLNIIRNEDKNFLNSLFQIRRRNIVIRKLIEYFQTANTVILDGFVNFRLKDYIKDLEDVVDKAVDDFLMEREYKEFIRLLRYFVDIQEPKYNVIHVIAGFGNKYILLDENRNEITNDCVQEFMNEIPEGEINYDDLLVSSLITMAPKRLIIHGAKSFRNKELLETIKNVFWGKAVICNECDLCVACVVRSENKT